MRGVPRDTIHVSSVCGFSTISQLAKVFENVILRMTSDPSSATSTQLDKEWRYRVVILGALKPYLSIYRPHHAILCLFDSNIESLGFTIASHHGWGIAYGAIGIHSVDRFAKRIFSISTIHFSRGRAR